MAVEAAERAAPSDGTAGAPTLRIGLDAGRTARLLGAIAALLIVHHIGIKAAELLYFGDRDSAPFELYSAFFTVNAEGIVPTVFSMLGLMFCAVLLAVIGWSTRSAGQSGARLWSALGAVFLFLAVDEGFEIHERLNDRFRDAFDASGWLLHAWVIPYAALLVVFLIVYARFTWRLPERTRRLFVAAGVLYIAGAVGMELVGSKITDDLGTDTVAYAAASTMEEVFELSGIVLFSYALLSHLQREVARTPRVAVTFD